MGKRLLTSARARTLAVLLATSLIASCGGDDADDAAEPAAEQGTRAGASSSAPGDQSDTTASAEPIAGGRLVMAFQFEPSTLNGLQCCPASGFVSSPAFVTVAIFDVLAYEDPETGELQMQTAESITSEDALAWTIKLKPDITFSDGTPYDADALAFNLERHRVPDNRSTAISTAGQIESLEVVDPLTLRVALKSPNAQFDRALATSQLGQLHSPAAVEAGGADYGAGVLPVGAGPFTVKEWVRGGHITLVRNPSYWDSPKPYLDELYFQIVTDGDQRINTLLAGQADATSPANQMRLVTKARESGANLIEVTPPLYREIFTLNTKRPPFDDVRARRALQAAVDYGLIMDTLHDGLKRVMTSFVSEGSPFYDSSLVVEGHDPELAQRLFDEIYEETGQDVEFTFTFSTNGGQEEGEAITAQLSQYEHVNASFEVIAPSDFASRTPTGNFQAIVNAFIGYDPHPTWTNALLSTSAANASGYGNPEMDEQLLIGAQSLDTETRAAAYKRVQELLIRDVPYVLRSDSPGFFIYGDRVQNVRVAAGFPWWQDMWVTS